MSLLLRSGCHQRNHLLFNYNKKLMPNAIRNTSNDSNSNELPKQKRSNNIALKLITVTAIGFGIGFGYTKYNPDFRKQIESAIPYSDKAFSFIDSIVNPTEPTPPKVTELKPINKVEQQPKVVLDKKIKNEKTNSTNNAKPELEKTKPILSTSVQTDTNSETQLESAKTEIISDWKQTLKEHGLQEEATIKAIEQKLNTGINDVIARVFEAIRSSSKSIETLNKYGESLKLALDDTKDDSKDLQWRNVTDLFDLQSIDVKEANLKVDAAKKAIIDLDRLLVDVKSSDLSKYIKNLRETQLELIKQFGQLQNEKTKLSEAVIHANVLRSYTNEQKTARNQFLKEIQSLQPEGIRSKTSDENLSSEELNNLLIHAHKRLLQLQKQIVKMQNLENQHIQLALEDQRKQFETIEKENLNSTLDNAKREFELEKEKTIEETRFILNENLKKELSRQAAAHNNHLAQMLKLQQEELEQLYQRNLLIESERIRKKFYDDVATSFGRVKGIEHALLARANLEFQAQNAKQLWLGIQNLNGIIVSKAEDLKNNLNNSELAEILTNVNIIKDSAPDNEFIKTIISSLSSVTLDRGIWTEPDLKERYKNVKSICRKVSLIDDRGGSLMKYLLSYFQSLFIFNVPTNDITHDLDLTNKQLNTFTILDYAQYFIEQGDFEAAIKLLQQLKGEPKRLAKDWINEALLLLEVKQACALLTAYISSVYIGTNLKD